MKHALFCVGLCAYLAIFLDFFCFPSSIAAQTTAPGEWTWMGGNNAVSATCASGTLAPCGTSGTILGNVGVYGTLGVPAAGNIPGSRSGASTWVDKSGNFWLFGGSGIDSTNTFGALNDLWMFNPSTNEWTWMSGGSSISSSCVQVTSGPSTGLYYDCGLPGEYGTLGVPAAGNIPAGRSEASNWIDDSGNFWLLGGAASIGTGLNDLWEYSPSSNEWTWMGGSVPPPNTCTANCVPSGVYDTLGTPNAANVPEGRSFAADWTDAQGNFWVFGGVGSDGDLNDLMEFVPSANEWTWMGGSNPTGQGYKGAPGVYGTLDVFASGNIPGSRGGASYWTDSRGNFWLLGGDLVNLDAPAGNFYSIQNDFWEFTPSINMWAWMGGQNSPSDCFATLYTCNGSAGVYGTLGVAAAGNIPSARVGASTWTDKQDHLWLFGGDALYSTLPPGILFSPNGPDYDLWVFDLATNEWTWMGGPSPMPSAAALPPGVYGTLGVPASGNVPGAREGAATWTDQKGNLWLFGGGFSPNDLWVYGPPASTAVPVFSVAAGTYTATQNVSITDSTANATVYYTTDGSQPTTGSTPYTGPISVSSTETLQAVAVANGFLSSGVASAAYMIGPPPDFSIAASPATISVTAGASATATISLAPQGGFASAVSFACSSGLPAGASCSFSPASVTPPGTTSTSVTVTTSAATAKQRRNGFPMLPESALAIALCGFGLRKRRRLLTFFVLSLSAAGLGFLNGCGGGSSGPPPPTPVTSTVTITATSGALSHATTISLTVN